MLSKRDEQALIATANLLVKDNKGLLAMDESTPTCNKRFAALGIAQTEETRRRYRELLITTEGLQEYISGAILYDETIRQNNSSGVSFLQILSGAGIIPGIKLDTGAKSMALHLDEKITEGLDGLRERLAEYSAMGARFAKWRAVISIKLNAKGQGSLPSRACIEANTLTLARYACLCQEAGLVPIVEPEVVMDGDHGLHDCQETTTEVLQSLFHQFYRQNVMLEGMILKCNMILPGFNASESASLDDVVDATVKCLLQTVPAAIPGIAFLSGGQSAELASARLNAMNLKFKSTLPWPLTFSFARALQQPALEIWQGKESKRLAAQKELLYRAKCNHDACMGSYHER